MYCNPGYKSGAIHSNTTIATHASVKKVVTCSRWMAILRKKENKKKQKKIMKKTIREKEQA
jgi:hypothetical protein